MNREDVIRMAREADGRMTDSVIGVSALERFTHLIASHVAEECAKACKDVRDGGSGTPKAYEDTHADGFMDGCNECEWAIRSLYKPTVG